MIFEHLDRIVFTGDSVTDMGSVKPIGEGLFDNAGHGYVRMVDNLLASAYPERCIRVTNAGISGNTSRMLLERFDRDCIDLDPDWVSICIGINDVWRQFDAPAFTDQAGYPEEYEANLTAMIEKCKRKVVRTQGKENAFWVILDYGEIVVHVFQTPYRAFYRLEDLWADAERTSYED